MDIYDLATELHSMYCKSSHTDYCGWEYEKTREDMWTEKYSAHATYLRYANNITEELPNYSLENIFEVAKGIKAGMRTPYKDRWQ